MIENNGQITVVERASLWRLNLARTLRQNGLDITIVNPETESLEPTIVAGRLHIVRALTPTNRHLQPVRTILELGGSSLVVPGREYVEQISEEFMGLSGVYVAPEHMICKPEMLARAALQLMWGRG